MALRFGWRKNDVRESFWKDDPHFFDAVDGKQVSRVTEQAEEAWLVDGDAEHLRPFVKPGIDPPTRVEFRTLTLDEVGVVRGLREMLDDNPTEFWHRATYLCFRLAVSFPDMGPTFTAGSITHARVVRDRGLSMLAEPWVRALDEAHPGIVKFYGRLVLASSFLTEPEKKA